MQKTPNNTLITLLTPSTRVTEQPNTKTSILDRVDYGAYQSSGMLDITMLFPSLAGGGWREKLRKVINDLLGVPQLNRLFKNAEHVQNPFTFILDQLKIFTDTGDLTEKIPKKGACIVVANHPNGGTDALTLMGSCVSQRGDTQVLANSILNELPGIANWLIPLNIMSEKGAVQHNQIAMKSAIGHLRQGGLLVAFPAGTISHWRGDMGRVADPEWSNHIARLAKKANVPVLPVRIFEKNPAWFNFLGAFHLNIRSALVPRLLLSSRGKSLRCRAGDMIQPDQQEAYEKAKDAIRMIRGVVQSIKLTNP